VFIGLQFESEIQKQRIDALTKHTEILEQKMHHYQEQQSLFNYLRNDLRVYKEVFQKAMEFETMYAPLTPTH
jgi:hemerythrin-like domain-containing protein